MERLSVNLLEELREINTMENEIGSYNLRILKDICNNKKEFNKLYNKVKEVIENKGMKFISKYSDLYEEIDFALEDKDKEYFIELSEELNNSIKLNDKLYI